MQVDIDELARGWNSAVQRKLEEHVQTAITEDLCVVNSASEEDVGNNSFDASSNVTFLLFLVVFIVVFLVVGIL